VRAAGFFFPPRRTVAATVPPVAAADGLLRGWRGLLLARVLGRLGGGAAAQDDDALMKSLRESTGKEAGK